MTLPKLMRLSYMDWKHFRLAGVALLAVYGLVCLRTPNSGRLLDGVDLAVHETGHIVFSPFGEIMTALGGTLFQLIIPLTFAVYFWRRQDRYAAGFALWWVAQNLWNISVYVRDARALELPLLGGGEHDWAFLLGEAGWLNRDIALGQAIHALGVAIYLVAIGLSGVAAARAQSAEPAEATA
ncbi:MAG: hypothetical protein M3365_01025 [Gemmatimonadota bacterium]|nr:hypothetical protein [Gemmatimonadota bacterium]